jgi:hypothetical protein
VTDFDEHADSFEPGQGHEPAGEWVGGPHDGMGPECLAEKARNAPPSGSNHKNIVVRHPVHTCLLSPTAAFSTAHTSLTQLSVDCVSRLCAGTSLNRLCTLHAACLCLQQRNKSERCCATQHVVLLLRDT